MAKPATTDGANAASFARLLARCVSELSGMVEISARRRRVSGRDAHAARKSIPISAVMWPRSLASLLLRPPPCGRSTLSLVAALASPDTAGLEGTWSVCWLIGLPLLAHGPSECPYPPGTPEPRTVLLWPLCVAQSHT